MNLLDRELWTRKDPVYLLDRELWTRKDPVNLLVRELWTRKDSMNLLGRELWTRKDPARKLSTIHNQGRNLSVRELGNLSGREPLDREKSCQDGV